MPEVRHASDRSRLVVAFAIVAFAGCYHDRSPVSRAPGPPPPESYDTIARLEDEGIRPIASDVGVRIVQEGTTAGVAERASRAALLAERRADLYRIGNVTEFRRLAAEDVGRWRALAQAARIEDLETARRIWGELDAGCRGCHDLAGKEAR